MLACTPVNAHTVTHKCMQKHNDMPERRGAGEKARGHKLVSTATYAAALRPTILVVSPARVDAALLQLGQAAVQLVVEQTFNSHTNVTPDVIGTQS